MRRDSSYSVTLGDEVATVRRSGSRVYTTARILGREVDAEGTETVWLDRVVMPYGTTTEDGWAVTGAITTILNRQKAAQGHAIR